MRFTVAALRDAGVPPERIYVSMERNMQCGIGHCGHCQLGPTLVCRDGPVYRGRARAVARDPGAVMDDAARPTLAVGSSPPATAASSACSICEDELLALAEQRRDRLLPRGARAPPSRGPTTSRWSRARSPPPMTRSGSARSARSSRALITIGACATAGGIQALRNFADVEEFTRSSTPRPSTSRRSRPRRRSRRTCRSTSSCTAARSTSASCSR